VNRLGWTILALIVLAGLAFAAMLGGGGERAPQQPAAQRQAASGRLLVPVVGVARRQLVDSWGDSRAGGGRSHSAIDIAAPGGTPVIAAADGTVEKLFLSNDGGITAYLRSPDGGTIYYYAHLAAYAAGLAEGQRLRAGDPIGFVGDTGNAGAGNTHLHFGVSRMQPGQRWHEGEAVNPYPMLVAAAPGR
jgi:peptidoglycan LD-endopeptidase LytH